MLIRRYEQYDKEQIMSLYESVGWVNYTRDPAMLERAYANSLCTLAAYEGECLAGIIRAVGDAASIIYVQDLLIRPEYRRGGMGTALLHGLMELYPDVYQMVLISDITKENDAFYRSLGFAPVTKVGCAAYIIHRG